VGLCGEEIGEEVKKFSIPSRIKIKNKVAYEIAWVDEFKEPNTVGECRFDERQIAMKTKQSEKEQFKTFVHEVLHAVCEERGIKISHRAIYQLEDALFYILFHNDWE
jgi:hypothetical protein